jgi:hypothetical protein
MDTAPPADSVDDDVPAAIETSPPAMETSPAAPAAEIPLDSDTPPLEPTEAEPDDSETPPLAAPSAEVTATLPLDAILLAPLCTDNELPDSLTEPPAPLAPF